MKSALYTYRYLLGALLLIAALLNCFFRFWGDARPFFSALMLQLWFGQAVFAYLRGSWASIGPGGKTSVQMFEKADQQVIATSRKTLSLMPGRWRQKVAFPAC